MDYYSNIRESFDKSLENIRDVANIKLMLIDN